MTAARKILLVADGNAAELYADALAEGFTALGHQVSQFTWQDIFQRYPYRAAPAGLLAKLKSVYYRAQNKYTWGPAMLALNQALVRQARATQPDLIFIYRGTHIWPATLRALRHHCPHTRIFGYNNDDPFSPRYPSGFWRHFLRGLPSYDHLFAYRPANLTAFRAQGIPAHKTSLLRAYYRKQANYLMTPAPPRTTDVIFIGHFEDDGRDHTLKYLIDNGISLKIHGTGWAKSPLYPAFTRLMHGPIQPLRGAAYNHALNTSKLALVFLSKLNSDTYTRRCFEIPAAGACMVSEYTDDLAYNLFVPDKEAVYFTSAGDLLTRVRHLLSNPQNIKEIADAGHARLLKDGHEATDRAHEILSFLK